MKPGQHHQLDLPRRPASRQRVVALLAGPARRRARTRRSRRRPPRARSSPRASARLDTDPDDLDVRAGELVEQRLEVRALARDQHCDPERPRSRPSRGDAQHRIGAVRSSRACPPRSARPRARGCRRGACATTRRTPAARRRSCGGSSCCARRGGSRRRWFARRRAAPRAPPTMIASSRFSIVDRVRRRRLGAQHGMADVAARAGSALGLRRHRRSGAGSPAAGSVVLDVRPDLPVLAPARPRGLLDRRPAERRGAPVEAPRDAAGGAVRRRGRGRDHPRPGQVADAARATARRRRPGRAPAAPCGEP